MAISAQIFTERHIVLADLVHCLRKTVLWAFLVGLLLSGSLQLWGTQASELMSLETAAIEQTVDDPSVSPCNGQCVVDSMLCKVSACASGHPPKIVVVRRVWSVTWPIIPLTLIGRAIIIEPEPPKYG